MVAALPTAIANMKYYTTGTYPWDCRNLHNTLGGNITNVTHILVKLAHIVKPSISSQIAVRSCHNYPLTSIISLNPVAEWSWNSAKWIQQQSNELWEMYKQKSYWWAIQPCQLHWWPFASIWIAAENRTHISTNSLNLGMHTYTLHI